MSVRKDSFKGGIAQNPSVPHTQRMILPGEILSGAVMQFKQHWKLLLLLYIPILLLFVALRVISQLSDDLSMSYFTRDVAAIAGLPFYAGLLSQLGSLVWAASVAICVFGAVVLHRQNAGFTTAQRLMWTGAFLTAVLLFDDVFQFHEEIGEDYLGISEKVSVLGLGVLGVTFLLLNLKEILRSEYLLLTLALIFFGLSVALDAADLDDLGRIGRFFNTYFQTFAEDGFKFAGITTWLVYFARYAIQKLHTTVAGTS